MDPEDGTPESGAERNPDAILQKLDRDVADLTALFTASGQSEPELLAAFRAQLDAIRRAEAAGQPLPLTTLHGTSPSGDGMVIGISIDPAGPFGLPLPSALPSPEPPRPGPRTTKGGP